jgi:hypothetical protein
MAFNVVLRPQAEEDLAAIYEYIAQAIRSARLSISVGFGSVARH